jgi:hypothetical protein
MGMAVFVLWSGYYGDLEMKDNSAFGYLAALSVPEFRIFINRMQGIYYNYLYNS